MAESQENVDAAVVRGRSSIPAVSVGLQAPVLGAVLALGGSLGQQEGRGLPSVCDPRAWRDPPPQRSGSVQSTQDTMLDILHAKYLFSRSYLILK